MIPEWGSLHLGAHGGNVEITFLPEANATTIASVSQPTTKFAFANAIAKVSPSSSTIFRLALEANASQ